MTNTHYYFTSWQEAYDFLIEYSYFSQGELDLVLGINGCRLDVLNDCTRWKYALDIEDLVAEIKGETK